MQRGDEQREVTLDHFVHCRTAAQECPQRPHHSHNLTILNAPLVVLLLVATRGGCCLRRHAPRQLIATREGCVVRVLWVCAAVLTHRPLHRAH
jgi:hypothetical protein